MLANNREVSTQVSQIENFISNRADMMFWKFSDEHLSPIS